LQLQKLLSNVFHVENELFDRAVLVLKDGAVFYGFSIGHQGTSSGEVVFNTSMTGYQEIISDPSYMGQMITLTYPHIGNVGCNQEDLEAKKIFSNGLIIREAPKNYSNYRASESLINFLKKNRIVAIAGIDTRKLTRHLRVNGAINGAIVTFNNKSEFSFDDAVKKALSLSRSCKSLSGKNLAKEVTTDTKYSWKDSTWNFQTTAGSSKTLIVVFDLGVKTNILRNFANLGVNVLVVPYKTSYKEALKLGANGIFLSNGPGDPEPCKEVIDVAKEAIQDKLPIFGICLGHQILAIASGAKTKKNEGRSSWS
jgi:carbamoyl-phosphate synthase small subunit